MISTVMVEELLRPYAFPPHVLEPLVERRGAVGHDADGREERGEVDRVRGRHVVVALMRGGLDLLLFKVIVPPCISMVSRTELRTVMGKLALILSAFSMPSKRS